MDFYKKLKKAIYGLTYLLAELIQFLANLSPNMTIPQSV